MLDVFLNQEFITKNSNYLLPSTLYFKPFFKHSSNNIYWKCFEM